MHQPESALRQGRSSSESLPGQVTEASDVRWFLNEVRDKIRRNGRLRTSLRLLLKGRIGVDREETADGSAAPLSWFDDAILTSALAVTIPVRPAPDFDEQAYLRSHPDVSLAVADGRYSTGFAHYVQKGRYENRTRFYRDPALNGSGQGREADAAKALALLGPHANEAPGIEGLMTDEARLLVAYHHILRKFALVDEDFYGAKYLKGERSVMDPVYHYLLVGSRMGFRPNPSFDPVSYRAFNPSSADLEPAVHFALYGPGQSPQSWFRAPPRDKSHAVRKQKRRGLKSLRRLFLRRRRGSTAASRGSASKTTTYPTGPFGDRSSGTILFVTHDMEIGGAQTLVKLAALWLLQSTKYDVKIVSMRGGTWSETFSKIAPVFNVDGYSKRYDRETTQSMLREFAGPRVSGLFVNSVASGPFFDYWEEDTPAVAYIHELPRIIKSFGDSIEKIKARASLVLGGSEAVRDALQYEYGIEPSRSGVLYSFIEDSPSLEEVSARREKSRRALGVAADDFVVLGCGVLHWRKSPDKFIEVAERVSKILDGKCRFVWIGGGPDEEDCRRLVKDKGLEKVIDILGHRDDLDDLFPAGDVFLLPSEEDPFPLVGLYAAAAAVPIVCFEEAGGMPEFVARGCGAAVPFQDVEKMAEAVLAYHADPDSRARHGEVGRREVHSHFTIRSAGPTLLDHLRREMGVKPHVSVVVPNYNYDRFLPERLQAIFDQTFQDFELILLDDASTDDSAATLRDWVGRRAATKLVINEDNSGSPFRQWLKGLELAESDLIWVAEADDTCSDDLLASLLPSFDNRNVFLGFVKSVPINEEGRVIGDYETSYLDRISPGRWSRSYLVSDFQEIYGAMAIANTIPNASSVVFRRFEPEPEFVETVTGMRMSGDWYFYLRAMRGGFVAYSANPANRHRRHTETVTHKTEGSLRYFDERRQVESYVGTHYNLAAATRARMRDFTDAEAARFGAQQNVATTLDAPPKKARPSLLVTTSDLSPGGGQMFAVRLANAWAKAGGRAMLLNVGQYPDHPEVTSRVRSDVAVFDANAPDFNLRRIIHECDIDIIHSSIYWADRYIYLMSNDVPPHVRWVATMHGCYETLLDQNADPRFREHAEGMIRRVDQWIYIADKNLRVFEELGFPEHLQKLPNGYEPEPIRPIDRADLGLRPDSFVLCLASRAIAAKGWREAVQAVVRLNETGRNVELMLLGDGPEADHIRALNPPSSIHLYGHVGNVQDYIAHADVGLLPSSFVGESQPLTLIEAMAQGKPVVATAIGDVPNMIAGADGDAGVLVPIAEGKVSVDALADAIEALFDADTYSRASRVASEQFKSRYSMDIMLANYADIYSMLRDGAETR